MKRFFIEFTYFIVLTIIVTLVRNYLIKSDFLITTYLLVSILTEIRVNDYYNRKKL